MKTLNNLTLNDILGGHGVNCKYKGFTILYHNGYINIYRNDHNINSFVFTSSNIGELKTKIKNEINSML